VRNGAAPAITHPYIPAPHISTKNSLPTASQPTVGTSILSWMQNYRLTINSTPTDPPLTARYELRGSIDEFVSRPAPSWTATHETRGTGSPSSTRNSVETDQSKSERGLSIGLEKSGCKRACNHSGLKYSVVNEGERVVAQTSFRVEASGRRDGGRPMAQSNKIGTTD
jgi:hypothetical protein